MENPTSIAENLSTTYFTFSVIYLKKRCTLSGDFIIAFKSLSVPSTNPANVIGPETETPTPQNPSAISLSLAVAL